MKANEKKKKEARTRSLFLPVVPGKTLPILGLHFIFVCLCFVSCWDSGYCFFFLFHPAMCFLSITHGKPVLKSVLYFFCSDANLCTFLGSCFVWEGFSCKTHGTKEGILIMHMVLLR